MRYSIWYSNQNTQLILTIIINKINYRFRLPRPTTSSSKDVHGRLFLCLKSSKYGGFRAAGGFPVFLSSRRFGIPNGIPGYLGLILGIPKGVMEYFSCALKPPASPTASSRRSNRKTRITSSGMGDELQLRVRVNRSMQWNFNYRHPVTKNRINMAFNAYPEVSLAQARRKTVEAR